ncbi:MAG: methionine synthase, partial [Pseudonocardia sp. SCN 72-86]
MQRSDDRILTTHVGSLARPRDLLEVMREKEHGRPYDVDGYAKRVTEAVDEVVREQVSAGIDVVTDGEMSKVSFLTYVKDRLTGFDTGTGEKLMPPSWQVEIDAFPDYYAGYLGKYKDQVSPMTTMVCTGPITYDGHAQLQTDVDNLRAAIAAAPGDVTEAFLPSTSPSGFGRNEFYGSHGEYLAAVAEALRDEYLAIIDAGFVLQVDDPWLIEYLSENPATTPEQRVRDAEQHIEILNHALRGIPTEKIRLHTCYGLNHGPRIHDLAFRDIAPLMLKVNAGAYSFEVANPRHQHEWKIWRDVTLPDGKVLIPGLLGHASNYVEHPELIADTIELYAGIVG